MCAQSADVRKIITATTVAPCTHSTTLSNHTYNCVSNIAGGASTPRRRSAAHICEHHMCATSCIAGCACGRGSVAKIFPHTTNKQQLRGAHVFGAQRGGKEQLNRQNSKWKQPLATQPHIFDVVLHPRAKID